jgi:hypothetical protein
LASASDEIVEALMAGLQRAGWHGAEAAAVSEERPEEAVVH